MDNNTIQEKNSGYIGGVNPMLGQNPPSPGPGAGPGAGPGFPAGPMGGVFNDMGVPGGAPGRPAAAMSQNPTGSSRQSIYRCCCCYPLSAVESPLSSSLLLLSHPCLLLLSHPSLHPSYPIPVCFSYHNFGTAVLFPPSTYPPSPPCNPPLSPL